MKECAQTKSDSFHNFSTTAMGTAVAIMPSRTISTAVTQYMHAIARWQMHSKSFAGKAVCITKLPTPQWPSSHFIASFVAQCLFSVPGTGSNAMLTHMPLKHQSKSKLTGGEKAQEQQNTQESQQKLAFHTANSLHTCLHTQWLVKTNQKPCHYFTRALSSNLSVHEFELPNSSTC